MNPPIASKSEQAGCAHDERASGSEPITAASEGVASGIDVIHALGFRDYRAPREDGVAFVEPALDQALPMLKANRCLLADHRLFETIRQSARKQLIRDALKYTSVYRSTDWLSGDEVDQLAERPIVMAGHQPALFHAGVWFKNFALSHVAEQMGGIAVNLVIDNDVTSGSSIRVPTWNSDASGASYANVPFDDAVARVPYEQTTIRNRELFDSFDERVKTFISPLVENPCVDRLWHHARAAVERCGIAGCALAQARHGLEGELGLKTLELPLGVLCRTTAFAEFVLSILSELPRFHRCYNGAAVQYREAHGIRSTAHPVPNLAEQDGWFEAPLWIYGNSSTARRPVWVRLSDDQLVISDRVEREIEIDIRFPKLAAEKLSSMITPEFKLRPRALMTTMYARLILSDLFMHGIGGAKYDQLSDRIIKSFFMVEPPQFMVMSATVKLQSPTDSNGSERIKTLQRQLRDTRYQPERFADSVELDADLIQRKQFLLDNMAPRGERSQWHQEITDINRRLSASLDERRRQLMDELADARRQASSDAVVNSREHPFCVFSLQHLQQQFQRLLGGSETNR